MASYPTTSGRLWSSVAALKWILNPDCTVACEISITSAEVTFLGAEQQPDFATVTIVYVPAQRVIELKSLKLYLGAFRNRLLSYERFISVVFADLMAVYGPRRLRVTVACNPRGGLSSTLVIDSVQQRNSPGERSGGDGLASVPKVMV